MPAALLFDLDGTLLDSDPLHRAVFADMLAPHGHDVTETFYAAHIHGRQNVEVFQELIPGSDAPALDLAKEDEFRRCLEKTGATPAKGLVAFLDRAQAVGLPVAVVTNACRLNADAMLAAIGLADRFAAAISAEECRAPKPAPAPYLAGAAALGVPAHACIAFEDSPTGVASACAAGCTVIGVTSSLTPDALLQAGAHQTIADFTDPALGPLLDADTGALA